MSGKYAVLFPGIGYTLDKPLLYYSRKFAEGEGYEIIEVPYKNFKPGVKGNAEKMKEAFDLAMSQTEEILSGAGLEGADELLFISKSIGTAAAAAYAAKHDLKVRHIFYTPLKETFLFAASGNAVAFHGTADPWASDEDIIEGCREKEIPLIIVPDANHSLETGDAEKDLEILAQVMREAFPGKD